MTFVREVFAIATGIALVNAVIGTGTWVAFAILALLTAALVAYDLAPVARRRP